MYKDHNNGIKGWRSRLDSSKNQQPFNEINSSNYDFQLPVIRPTEFYYKLFLEL